MEDAKWNEELEKVLKENYQAGPDAQANAVEAFMTDPSPEAADRIWQILIVGLLVLIGVSLLGIIVLLVDGKDTQIVLTAFSALLTGLLGLFVQSPVKKEG